MYEYIPVRSDMPQVERKNISVKCYVMTVKGSEVLAHYNYGRHRWVWIRGNGKKPISVKDEVIAWRTA